jgi:ATPase subunit of ABC transporter with duplicated ATPase domains
MAHIPLKFHDVSFIYPAAAAPVFDRLSLHFTRGWTGVIGPNGSGKTTLLHLACGELAPQQGRIESPERVICCFQRTDHPPARLPEYLDAADPKACVLRGQLGVQPDWARRWSTLSHGERKRAQIAVALWLRPQVLALDEPTNHIDLDARRLLGKVLKQFRGIGLLVSHDRHLLDTLCVKTLIIDPPGAVMRPGGYTKAVRLARAERQYLKQERPRARQEVRRLRQEAARRGREAAQADRKRSKGKLKRGSSDAREKIDRARVTGKDGHAGRVKQQLAGRLEQSADRLRELRVKKEYRLGIEMCGELAKRDALFRLPADSVDLGRRRLVFPELRMGPADRIALTGPNGAGKRSSGCLTCLRRRSSASRRRSTRPPPGGLSRTCGNCPTRGSAT